MTTTNAPAAQQYFEETAAQQAANDLADEYANRPVTEPGVYETDAGVYRVKWNQAKTHLYAGRIVKIGNRTDFEYEFGSIRTLKAHDMIGLERIEELSIFFGVCCVCGRTLTDAKSVGRGIGPVCRKRVTRTAA